MVSKLSQFSPELPIIITMRNKYLVGVFGFILASALYLIPNHFHIAVPKLLPMTALDRVIPFIPQMVWIYISEYLFFIAIYLMSKDVQNLNRYLYSFMAMQVTAVIIFTLWPTTFPRELFPLPEALDSLTYGMFARLREMDSPANCAPSLHVGSVFLASFIFLREQPEKFKWFFGWATAIAISTLPTKQHYVVDVVLGLVMALIFYVLFHHYFRYAKPTPEQLKT